MDVVEILLVLVRFAIVLFVIYGCCALAWLAFKSVLNVGALMVGRIIRTVPGIVVIAGGVIYVVILALKTW
jgi:hypothetical protein